MRQGSPGNKWNEESESFPESCKQQQGWGGAQWESEKQGNMVELGHGKAAELGPETAKNRFTELNQ